MLYFRGATQNSRIDALTSTKINFQAYVRHHVKSSPTLAQIHQSQPVFHC